VENSDSQSSIKTDARGMRRRADKLRLISWANLLVCVGVGLFSDIGDTAMRWSIAMGWSVLLLIVCHVRAAQMDREGPIKRKQLF
jgi:hypothetical protein